MTLRKTFVNQLSNPHLSKAAAEFLLESRIFVEDYLTKNLSSISLPCGGAIRVARDDVLSFLLRRELFGTPESSK